MIFYEAPHKLSATLQDMLEAFGDRRISISRELTKIHEETIRTTLSYAVNHFHEVPPRGEFVLVIEGAAIQANPELSLDDALRIVGEYRADGLSLKDAAKKCSSETYFPKNVLYEAALKQRHQKS